jgi:mannose-1-phosphate guanylyltransferase
LFQQSVLRDQNLASSTINFDKTFIVANRDHRFLVLDQLKNKYPHKTLKDRNLLIKSADKFSSDRLKFEFGQILKAKIKTLGLLKV